MDGSAGYGNVEMRRWPESWIGDRMRALFLRPALQNATRSAAKLLKQEKELGSIAPGKLADLALVEGNPVEQISDVRRCRLVMKSGTVFKSDAVYAAVGIKLAE